MQVCASTVAILLRLYGAGMQSSVCEDLFQFPEPVSGWQEIEKTPQDGPCHTKSCYKVTLPHFLATCMSQVNSRLQQCLSSSRAGGTSSLRRME